MRSADASNAMPARATALLRSAITKCLAITGLDAPQERLASQRSFINSLEHACKLGLSPATVIDVGAAHGSFTSACCNIFPHARYLMVEALQEYETHLRRVVARIPKAEYVLCAASAQSGSATINVHSDLVGSSLYLECEESDVNGVPRTVPARLIDHICETKGTRGPYLMKIDVQGAELDVLAGCGRVLAETEYAILELSLFKFFQSGPQLYDVIDYMKSRGFVMYDIFDMQFRPLDNALSQVDVAFVPDDSKFRTHHFYATPEQRAEQDHILQQRPE